MLESLHSTHRTRNYPEQQIEKSYDKLLTLTRADTLIKRGGIRDTDSTLHYKIFKPTAKHSHYAKVPSSCCIKRLHSDNNKPMGKKNRWEMCKDVQGKESVCNSVTAYTHKMKTLFTCPTYLTVTKQRFS